MRTLFLITFCSYTAISSCYVNKTATESLGNHYKYSFQLQNSSDSEMHFDDSAVNLSFHVTDKSIKFTLQNKLRESIMIDWNDASITMFGRADQIIHNGVKYSKRFDPMRPTIVPPGDTINESVIPAYKVYQSTTHVHDPYVGNYAVAEGGWKINDLLICWDQNDATLRKEIQKTIGCKIELYLPIRDNSHKEFGYRFSFQVKGVTRAT